MTSRLTGRRSNINRHRFIIHASQNGRGLPTATVLRRSVGLAWYVLAVGLSALLAPGAACALDIFTLWRQEMIPIQIIEGAWVEYRHVSQSGGRSQEELFRVQCLVAASTDDPDSWWLEMVPLSEDDTGNRSPLPGEGLRLRMSRKILSREGRLIDHVLDVFQWREGRQQELPRQQWQDDPLVAASFDAEFDPQRVEFTSTVNRIVSRKDLACDQFDFTAADTQTVDLPRGRMVQTAAHEISVAISAHVPFLGIVFAAERIRADSFLDPPSERFRPPPPQVAVETLELLAFGNRATPILTATR